MDLEEAGPAVMDEQTIAAIASKATDQRIGTVRGGRMAVAAPIELSAHVDTTNPSCFHRKLPQSTGDQAGQAGLAGAPEFESVVAVEADFEIVGNQGDGLEVTAVEGGQGG